MPDTDYLNAPLPDGYHECPGQCGAWMRDDEPGECADCLERIADERAEEDAYWQEIDMRKGAPVDPLAPDVGNFD